MKFVSGLLALAALASAVPGNTPTPIDVHLEKAGNSQVKAVITNTGKTNLRLLKVGTILDKAVVEKTKVTTATGTYACLPANNSVTSTNDIVKARRLASKAFTSTSLPVVLTKTLSKASALASPSM